MRYLFFALCAITIACTAKTVAPPVQVPMVPFETPCEECAEVTLLQCYPSTSAVIVQFVATMEDGTVEYIAAPVEGFGCRCVIEVNGLGFVSVLPTPPELKLCDDWEDITYEPRTSIQKGEGRSPQ